MTHSSRCASVFGRRQRAAMNPMTVTRAKKNRKTARAAGSTSVFMGVRPVGEPRPERCHRRPGKLIPIEKRKTEKHRVMGIVERDSKQPDERQEKEPEMMSRHSTRLLGMLEGEIQEAGLTKE
jgi:hypothetical protein